MLLRASGRIPRSSLVRSFSSKAALICGGNGALGKSVVQGFNNDGWSTVSVDYKANADATTNIIMDPNVGWKANTQRVETELKVNNVSFDSIINVAGGWAGDTAADSSLFDNLDLMLDVNLRTSAASAYLAAKTLKPGGLLVLTGAKPVYDGGTGFMLSYAMAKAGVHNLVQSLSTPASNMPEGSDVICLLPVTIDTPANRLGQPSADFDEWTNPSVIAQCVVNWSNGDISVKNGEFYNFETIKDESGVINYVNGVKVA